MRPPLIVPLADLILPRFVDNPKGVKMRQELFMARRRRRKFTPEFKAEAVRLTRVGDRTIAQVALDLDLTETSLREWVKRADAAPA